MSLVCSICHEQSQQPQATQCGHVFCATHISKWLQNDCSCPVCRKPINAEFRLVTIFESNIKDAKAGDGSAGPSSPRSLPEDHNLIHDGVGVRGLLDLLHGKWETGVIDRARLRHKVAELEEVRQRLEESMQALKDENAELRAALARTKGDGYAANFCGDTKDEFEKPAAVSGDTPPTTLLFGPGALPTGVSACNGPSAATPGSSATAGGRSGSVVSSRSNSPPQVPVPPMQPLQLPGLASGVLSPGPGVLSRTGSSNSLFQQPPSSKAVGTPTSTARSIPSSAWAQGHEANALLPTPVAPALLPTPAAPGSPAARVLNAVVGGPVARMRVGSPIGTPPISTPIGTPPNGHLALFPEQLENIVPNGDLGGPRRISSPIGFPLHHRLSSMIAAPQAVHCRPAVDMPSSSPLGEPIWNDRLGMRTTIDSASEMPVPKPRTGMGVPKTWVLAQTISLHAQPVHGIAVHGTRPLVASASWDCTCKVFDVESNRLYTSLNNHSKGLYDVQFSRFNPTLLGTVSSDDLCRLWNFETGECLSVLEGHINEVNGLSFHWSTPVVATASDDQSAIVWDIAMGTPIHRLRGHKKVVYGVCFQPHGDMLATCSFDRTAMVWDWRTGAPIRTLEGHHDEIIGVDIDDAGRLIATGSDDTTCRLWDARMWQTLAVLREHTGEVKRIAFSPTGRLLATTSGDATARVWDMADFSCVSVLKGHGDHVFDAAWAADLGFVVTASHDAKWKLWRSL